MTFKSIAAYSASHQSQSPCMVCYTQHAVQQVYKQVSHVPESQLLPLPQRRPSGMAQTAGRSAPDPSRPAAEGRRAPLLHGECLCLSPGRR